MKPEYVQFLRDYLVALENDKQQLVSAKTEAATDLQSISDFDLWSLSERVENSAYFNQFSVGEFPKIIEAEFHAEIAATPNAVKAKNPEKEKASVDLLIKQRRIDVHIKYVERLALELSQYVEEFVASQNR